MLPANFGMNPVLTLPISSYAQIYLAFTGFVKVTGDREAGMDEVYSLLCAEAENQSWDQLEKDTIELLMWSFSQNFMKSFKCTSENSQFFGPTAITKIATPPEASIILTTRDSFSYSVSKLNFTGRNKWSVSETEWNIEILLNGSVKRLTELEVIESSASRKNLYIKSDTYSPYFSLSSSEILKTTPETSEYESEEDTSRQNTNAPEVNPAV